jgi:hypothetical protein
MTKHAETRKTGPAPQDSLMTTLARQVGRAAGEIVKAAQSLAPNESSASSDVLEKPAPRVPRRASSKKQKKHLKRKGRRRIPTVKTGSKAPAKNLKTKRRTS